MPRTLSPAEIRQQFPMPWRYVTNGGGQVFVLDAVNQEVPLFLLLDFTCEITSRVDKGTLGPL